MPNSNKVKIISFGPLSLHKDINKDSYASLTWSIRMGYPRLTVYTDNHNKKDNEFSYDNLIIAPMNAVMVNIFIGYMAKAIAHKGPVKYSLECYNIEYVNDMKTENVILQATAICGKDKDGILYLAVVSGEKTKVKFDILPNDKWHKIKNADGDIITDKAELSALYATAYTNRLKSLMDKHLADDAQVKYTDPKSKSV